VKKQINSISAFQFYQLVRYTTLILIGVIFTKTAISQSEIGEYETFVFIAGAVSFFWLNGLQKALLPLSANHKYKKIRHFQRFCCSSVSERYSCTFPVFYATGIFTISAEREKYS
jgi:hypothetical protein